VATVHTAPFFVPPTHIFGAHVPVSYPLKFCGGQQGGLAGTGFCKSTMHTLMASILDGVAGPATLNARDRVVAKELLFGHGMGFVAGSHTMTFVGGGLRSQPQRQPPSGSLGVRQSP
jgi:hypothetical protein